MSEPNNSPNIRIPGYRIEREIGRGGIATVYLAVQESLDREVALKVMSPVLAAEPNFTERFIGEGRMVAQLNHPCIVTIFDIAAENFHTFIAMEYLPGGSLREKLRRPMPEDTVLNIVRQMANALACAHDNGIVHRDVKPENIMFRDNGVPVLTDFGIAKTIGSDTQLTKTGIIVGTPRYISPEQAEGRGTDARSDLYSLGVILYEMLAGKPPFGTKDSIALLYAHVNDPIPDLPGEHRHLQPLVNATMAKDPDQRVSDCHKLSDMIYVIRREMRRRDAAGESTTPSGYADSTPSAANAGMPPAEAAAGRRWRPPLRATLGVLLIALLATAGVRTLFNAQSETNTAGVPQPESTSAGLTRPLPEPRSSDPVASPAARAVTGAAPRSDEAAVVAAVERGGSKAEQPSPPVPLLPPQERPAPHVRPAPGAASQSAPDSRGTAIATPAPVTVAPNAPQEPAWKVTPTDGGKAPTSRLQEMLSRAETQMAAGRVDEPAGDNALETYRQVLRVTAANPQAMSGLDDIARYFLDKSRESAEAKRYLDAQDMIVRGLRAVPQHSALLTFEKYVESLLTAEEEFAKAERYYRGRDVPRDLESAVQWYRKAADKGHVQSQYSLGIAYADGAGVPRDEAEGLRWLRRAAVQGVEDAQFNLSLGLIFGPEPDPSGASRWIKKLADKNYEPAIQVLGWMYSTGTGVKRSIKESIRWNVKHVMTDAPAGSSPPERVVEVWNRQLQAALAQTRLDHKPPEPH